ncbi:MAG: NTPase KAP [Spirochaetaceae bacterium]|nr:NTPase KAP [Spirochaetaceae bacterium]MBQ7882397.1 NTPase KAP [Treponema sp.]
MNKVTSQKSLYDAAVDELLKQVSVDLLTLVSGIVKEVTKIDVEEIIKRKKGFFKRIKDNTKLSAKDIDALIPLQHTLQEVRKNLKKLSEKFHILLIVDELDRCLPEYAIKVLERLHHVCDEIPIIQILAINKSVLADSISTVFGKNYSNTDNHDKWNTFFTDSYLQKFLDISIPLPNGTLNSRLEILNGLEKNYVPYIRPTNCGQEFIKLDEEFLILFITTLMDGVERRLQEKIFKQVELCHKLTIDSGINLNQERCTYAILIYEIISCICRYVFHLSETCKIFEGNENYSLVFSHVYLSSSKVTKVKYDKFNENLKNFLVSEIRNVPYVYQKYPFEIIDTKTYIMAYFWDSTKRSIDTLQNYLFDCIFEDKIFLQKYDEIMNIIIGK